MAFSLKHNKWAEIILGTFLVTLGVVAIVVTCLNEKNLTSVLSIVIAVSLFLFGGASILVTILSDTKSFMSLTLLYGALSIALGVLLCTKIDIVGNLITWFIAVFMIAFGGSELIKGIFLIRYRQPVIWIVASFVIAAIGIGFGIVAVIKTEAVLKVVYIILGSILVASGICRIVKTLMDSKKVATASGKGKSGGKKGGKKNANNVVDVPVKEVASETVPVDETSDK